jgi:hypothetical protein
MRLELFHVLVFDSLHELAATHQIVFRVPGKLARDHGKLIAKVSSGFTD